MDKFKAVWLSHSSIGDFLKCPRFYYLRNIYKDPKTGHKVTVMSPPLALGQIVHDVVESLSFLPIEERFTVSPVDKFNTAWKKVSGEMGGFKNAEQEEQYKKRGVDMLTNIMKNPGPIMNKAIKIKTEDGLPWYWFSEEDNIILCGKIDWIEYLEIDDSIHILDFKTGRNVENEDSLQLPIYLLLAQNTQSRKVSKLSYWYLSTEEGPIEQKLPDPREAKEKVGKVAQRIKLARQLQHFKCPTNGCKHCYPLEDILRNKGKLVGVSDYGQDIYIL